MSITVADCMKLPALSEAKVVSGHKGLNKIVSAVSVLEYAEASVLIDNLFVGNELVISAFTSIKDDVEAQCNAIRRLHETGEVGLVLYYLGIFLPSIDPRVLKISEELELPIIVMPEDRFDFRYSEVIMEVMEAVFRDQMQETYFVSGMLDRIAQLQERQRTIGSLFRMLSDRLRCSLLLIDRALTQRASAAWPMSMRWDYDLLLDFFRQGNLAQAPVRLSLNDRDVWVDHISVELEHHRGMHLVAVSEGRPLSPTHLQQAAEVIQLFFSIWKYDFGHEGPDALIRAILNDDPGSMQRIAASLHIDIQAIDTMWVLLSLQGADVDVKKKNERLALVSKVFLVERRKLALVDIVDDMVVMFMDAAAHAELQEGFADDYLNALGEETELLRLVVCPKLASTTDVRGAYLLIQDTAQEAFRIYPCRRYINAHELRFAQTCLTRFRQGEAAILHDMAPLAPLQSADDYDDLIETLAVYLLDANSSTAETGEMMFIHKNTVKYRINKIKQRLGYDINKMPEYYALYLAVALKRLMK